MSNPPDESESRGRRPNDLTPAEREWEAALSALRPAGPALSGPAADGSIARLMGLAGPTPNYLHTRDVVLRWGVRALPGPAEDAGPAPDPPTPRAWPGAASLQAADPATPTRPSTSPAP